MTKFIAFCYNGTEGLDKNEENIRKQQIVETDENLKAYAKYFKRYLEEYKKNGIAVKQIFFQNEFISDQKFPSCVWKPETIEKFLADYLIDEIGEIVAQSVVDFFSFPENQRMIERLLEAGVTPREAMKNEGGALQGMTLVVTGTLPTFSRQEAEEFIRNHGGTASGSVSRKTSYVVAGESAGSKLTKAQALGIPVITEAELIQLAQNG